jgi:hypothetical protein
MTFITEIEKSTLKFIWKNKNCQTTKALLRKKSNTGVTQYPTLTILQSHHNKNSMVGKSKMATRAQKQTT